MDCPCDPCLISQEWLHRAWHAANPGMRPTPWEAPRPPLYHAAPPGPLMQRLCYTFPLADGTNVSYPRQEVAMPDPPTVTAAQRRALSTEFLEHARALRELLRLAAEREQCIRDVWAQMMALDAAQRAPVAPRREEGTA